MKRLTETQKTAIRSYRKAGLGYKAIAGKMNLSRETVRSFCARNDVHTDGIGKTEGGHAYILSLYLHRLLPMLQKTASSESGDASEFKIGNTLFVISTSYSESASETLEKKLGKLILDDATRHSGSGCFVRA